MTSRTLRAILSIVLNVGAASLAGMAVQAWWDGDPDRITYAALAVPVLLVAWRAYMWVDEERDRARLVAKNAEIDRINRVVERLSRERQ